VLDISGCQNRKQQNNIITCLPVSNPPPVHLLSSQQPAYCYIIHLPLPCLCCCNSHSYHLCNDAGTNGLFGTKCSVQWRHSHEIVQSALPLPSLLGCIHHHQLKSRSSSVLTLTQIHHHHSSCLLLLLDQTHHRFIACRWIVEV
jgi:hypothetical protein